MTRIPLLALALLAGPAFAGHAFDGADPAQGEALYQEHCAACHGVTLEGQPDWRSPGPDGVYPAPPHDETGHTWHHPTAMLLDYTKLGGQAALARAGVTSFTSGMPAFGDQLSDRQILDILAWIASTWPDRIAASQRSRNPEH
ncbi:putative bifunctional cbb3-type cytochrome c oxidase subunit II/cytochrome c [Marinibacterium anthonyi]|nr:putative bifunctional cbb3-type cytochrome c oxidase subunit II/cytochrome c [Marinibacterium anthonyi]QEW18937.1 putative bifunctional cbb3-type cytochrome c oxidase subunit II/cytochrome c [Marinibacterium anthonyi]